jgi:hypothetical protein
MTARLVALAVCSVGLATVLTAQPVLEPLFIPLPERMLGAVTRDARSASRREVLSRQAVGMRLDRLFGGAARGQRLELTIGDRSFVAAFERLDSERGFRSWVGTLEGIDHSHVVFTERDGVVSGLVDAVTTVYQLTTAGNGVYTLEHIDRALLRSERDPLSAAAPAAAADQPTIALADDAGRIDVLILYTPAARSARGGTPGIEAAAAQSVSDSNTAFARSGVTTRYRFVGAVEIPFVETALMENDLTTITNSPVPRGLRNQYGADLVHVLLNSPDLSTCGIAWLLLSIGAPVFDAYSVSDISCIANYTPAHEMAHNLGANHAPEDGAFDAIFPYSFAYKDPLRGFRTVMAYACSGNFSCPRILNFSNPTVLHNGAPTGSEWQNNALTINNTAATIANLRQTAAATLVVPPTPTGLRSEVNGTAVTLHWNRTGELWTSYTLQVGSAPGIADYFAGPLGNVSTISGSAPRGVYYWWLIASNAAGSSAPSPVAQFTVGTPCPVPGPPQNFTFSVTGRIVTLVWSPPATGGAPASYIAEVGSAPGLTDLLSVSTGNSTTAAATPAPPGTYFVRFRAQNACGISAPSNEQRIDVQ